MLPTSGSVVAQSLLCVFIIPTAFLTADGQTTPPADAKLTLNAALVLTPDFCASRMKKKGETFETGEAACAEFEPALKGVFARLTRVAAAPSPADAQVVLVPRFVEIGMTAAATSFSNRELDLLLEWTVKDSAGRTVWIETVQGSAKHHAGTIGTVKKNRRLIVEDAVKDAAQQSASKMSSSPELRKLAIGGSSSANRKD